MSRALPQNPPLLGNDLRYVRLCRLQLSLPLRHQRSWHQPLAHIGLCAAHHLRARVHVCACARVRMRTVCARVLHVLRVGARSARVSFVLCALCVCLCVCVCVCNV